MDARRISSWILSEATCMRRLESMVASSGVKWLVRPSSARHAPAGRSPRGATPHLPHGTRVALQHRRNRHPEALADLREPAVSTASRVRPRCSERYSAPGGRHRDERSCSGHAQARDEAALGGLLPNRQARARGPPSLHHLALGPWLVSDPCEEVEDQAVDVLGHASISPEPGRRRYGLHETFDRGGSGASQAPEPAEVRRIRAMLSGPAQPRDHALLLAARAGRGRCPEALRRSPTRTSRRS